MDNINKMKLYHQEQERLKSEVYNLKKYTENFDKNINAGVDVSVSTCKLYADSRNNELKNFFLKKIDNLNAILSNTKNDLEINVMKKDEVKTLIKNEIKNTKKDILNVIEEQKKEKKEFKERDNIKEKTRKTRK